jgi:hypothetical protein
MIQTHKEINLVEITYTGKIKEDKIKTVNISNAEIFKVNSSVSESELLTFYAQSALESLFSLIEGCLDKNYINSIFIEWSSKLSTVGHNKYIVFTGVMENNPHFPYIDIKLLEYLFPYNFITDKHFPLYYHKDFFANPEKNITCHFSKLDAEPFLKLQDELLLLDKDSNHYDTEFEQLIKSIQNQIKVEKSYPISYYPIMDGKYRIENYTFKLNDNEFNKHVKEKKRIRPAESHRKWHILWHQLCRPNETTPKSYFLSIPIVGTQNKVNSKSIDSFFGQGACSIFINAKNDIEDKKFVQLIKLTDHFLKTVTYNYAFEVGKELAKNTQIYATQSAISQVFARNMSHNIGSHVSYRATNAQVKKRAKELYPIVETNKEDFATWLDYFSEKLDKYEIYRNEYLADFDQSPKFVRFYQDLILPFCENMLVMDNIAAGESLHYKTIHNNKLKIKCLINGREIKASYPDLVCMIADKDCPEEINYPYHFPYLLKNKDFPTKYDEPDTEKQMAKYSLESAIANKQIKWVDTEGVAEDVEICLHSEQAIYSILENFIRNSAKHKPKGSGDELIIYLDLRKKENDDYYTLYLYDNSSKVEKRFLHNDNPNKAGIYQRINESLLEETGKPRRANWGFADMKINSFLLLNKVDAIEDTKLPKNFGLVVMDDVQHPFLVDNDSIKELKDGEEYRFGYKIQMSIARKILWVGAFEGDNQAQLEKQGLLVVKNLEDIKSIKSEGLVAFQFVVINTDFTEGGYLAIEEKLPGRIIVLNTQQAVVSGDKTRIVKANASTMPMDTMPNLLKWCWQEWLTARNGAIDMYSYFEDAVIAKQWEDIKLAENLNSVIIDALDAPKTLQDDVVNIVYNRHGGAFNSGRIECEQYKHEEIVNFATKHSIIFFDKGSEDFSLLSYPPQDANDKELLMYQLMDAATTNVFIIDERISEYACNDLPNEFRTNGVPVGSEQLQNSNWSMYAAGKLFVIQEIKNGDVSCNVGNTEEKLTLDIQGESMHLLSDIENLGEIDHIRKDVLIVHRTYLDNAKIGMEPEAFLKSAKEQFGSVFITSGGGYPHNLTMSCKFIPFSTLESCINSRLSKNKLNSLIKSNIR